MHRRKLVQTMAASVWAPSVLRVSRAIAAPYRVRVAVNLAASHPVSIRAAEVVQTIRQATEGQLELVVLTADQLVPSSDLLTQLRRGTINLLALSGLNLSRLVPAAAICATGFAWRSYEQLWTAMDGEFGAALRGEIGKAALFAMPRIWDGGFRQITTSTRSVVDAADLRQLKIRVPAHPLWTQMFRAFDSIPAVITFTELHSALKAKSVEAQENALVTIHAARLYEVQSYLSQTNHMWDGFWWLADAANWHTLPEDLQTLILTNLDAAATKQRQDMIALNQRLLLEFSERGMHVNATLMDSFRSRLAEAGFYRDLRAGFTPSLWDLFDRLTGLTG
jgi:TRAP-type transport system periplasmic protein